MKSNFKKYGEVNSWIDFWNPGEMCHNYIFYKRNKEKILLGHM